MRRVAHDDRHPANLTVRPATLADVARIAELERQSFADPWSRGSFAALVGNPHVLFMVAETSDGTIAGYVVAWFVVDEAEIANLAVASPMRRQGVGATLLDAVIATAQARGASTTYLEVRDSNTAARALYASRGFAEVGRRRHYYRRPMEDALILRRDATN